MGGLNRLPYVQRLSGPLRDLQKIISRQFLSILAVPTGAAVLFLGLLSGARSHARRGSSVRCRCRQKGSGRFPFDGRESQDIAPCHHIGGNISHSPTSSESSSSDAAGSSDGSQCVALLLYCSLPLGHGLLRHRAPLQPGGNSSPGSRATKRTSQKILAQATPSGLLSPPG